jgi:hypothetical protein
MFICAKEAPMNGKCIDFLIEKPVAMPILRQVVEHCFRKPPKNSRRRRVL